MKYAVIYESATGNTKMLADEIRDTLGEENCVCFGTPGENMAGGAEEAEPAEQKKQNYFFSGSGQTKENAVRRLENIWKHCMDKKWFFSARRDLAVRSSISHRF